MNKMNSKQRIIMESDAINLEQLDNIEGKEFSDEEELLEYLEY